MRRIALLVALGMMALVVLPLVPASAATGKGCTGSAMSYSDRGIPLDKISVPGTTGTRDHPFEVMWNGKIDWKGQTAAAIKKGTWHVDVNGSNWLIKVAELASGGVSGKITNEKGETQKSGSFVPSSQIPVMFPGTYEVSFTATGADGAKASATLWIKVVTSPTGSPLWWLAIVLILFALILFAFSGLSWLSSIFAARRAPSGRR